MPSPSFDRSTSLDRVRSALRLIRRHLAILQREVDLLIELGRTALRATDELKRRSR